MASTAALVVTSVASGGFALLGVGVTNLTTARREQARFRTETALELASLERLIWGEEWVDLEVQLQQQAARLSVAGVPDDLSEVLREISLACWRDGRASFEQSGGEYGGIALRLNEARRHVDRAVRAYLLRKGRRSTRDKDRRAAVAAVQSVLAEPEYQHYRSS
jgi:hypothetical protein